MNNAQLENEVARIARAHAGDSEKLPGDAIETLLAYIDMLEYRLNRIYGVLGDMQTIPEDKLAEAPRRIVRIIRRVNGWE